ncbi:DUF6443 domain-containing protein [Flavobacterium sp. RS13.1]|uniref:DUF6443 domain-containing protein n=1 Tax=Flavobacterium sp. RS13.1 TaxID=3400345 RepID=UPI003AACAD0B
MNFNKRIEFLIIVLLVLLSTNTVVAQTNENYIHTVVPQEGATDIATLATSQKIEAISYFDGLGRPKQNIAVRAGVKSDGTPIDIITHIEYDAFGRQVKEYLPYTDAGSSGAFRVGDINTLTKSFYNTNKYENTLNPYSEKEFEASPLNRILKQAAPGNDWALKSDSNGDGSICFDYNSLSYNSSVCVEYRNSVQSGTTDWRFSCYYSSYYGYGSSDCTTFRNANPLPPMGNNTADHTIKLQYQTNTNADQVRRFGVSFIVGNTENPYLEDEGIYDPAQLYKTVTKDENWQANQTYPNDHTTEEFKDNQGNVVLKRTFDAGKWLDTYYVYDDYGNLTYVLPPKLLTYGSIIQPNIGQSYYADSDYQGISIFNDEMYAEIALSQNSGILSYRFYTYGFTPGSLLRSGKIATLDFNPDLPNISLGNIIAFDINGSSVVVGTAYIQDGDLYFSSNGVSVYPDENGELLFNKSLNLSDFQATYTPALDRSTLDDLIYQYRYDKRNRLIEKKLPGKGWEYIVYDKLDRPVLTQDANLRTSKKWLFTKYDVFNRPVYTGEYINIVKTARADVQLLADAGTALSESKQTVNSINGTTVYYSNNVFPNTTDINLLTINYYDDYSFDLSGGGPATSYNVTPITNAKGLATGSKIRVLDTTSWITSLNYYDAKSRLVYSYSKNDYLGTTSTLKSQFNFIGETLATTATHLRNGVTTTVVDNFTYDHSGRITDHTQAINGATIPEVIVSNTYDELGQLISKKVGGKTPQGLQKVDYAYNIRGWLKSINDPNSLNQDNDLFGFGLNYNTIVNPSLASYYQNKPLYNGNISSTSWKTNNLNSVLKQYNYTYDAVNRLRGASYLENNVSNSKFDESISEYDRNGNIMNLSRNMQRPGGSDSFIIDYLTYTYDKGNRLIKVDDNPWFTAYSDEGFKDTNKGSNDYSYDDNGNMTVDKNKAITNIFYNHLNLPVKILFNTGKSIDYVYDATGVKQSKKVINLVTTTTDYAGGFQYVNNVLKFFPQPEGYVEYNSGNFNYIYQYKDHLGNIRLSYADSNNDGIIAPPVANIYQTLWEDGFESDTGWSNVDSEISHPLLNFDTTVKHSGNRSARITMDRSSNGDGRAVQSNQWIAINNTEETFYRISGWIFIQNAAQFTRGILSLEMKTGDANPITQREFVNVDNSGQWIFVQKQILVPASFKYLNLLLSLETSNADFTVRSAWYDDLKIEKVIPNSQNEIISESSYYPFGLEHNTGNNVVTSTSAGYKYRYNGKELQDDLELGMYDYLFRQYMPDLGRFTAIDPMADFVNYQSPYVFSDNSPIMNIDDDGLGILNVIGNLFRRLRNGIIDIACNSCNPHREEDLITSWKNPDFGWYVSNKGSSRRYEKNDNTEEGKGRNPVEGIDLAPVGITTGGNGIESPEINIPTRHIASPSSRRRPPIPIIGNRAIVSFNRAIEFENSSTKLNTPHTEKTLRDLIKTLVDYPQLIVSISANVAIKTDMPLTRDTGVRMDGKDATIGDLQSARAKSIQRFLIKRGVNPKQILIKDGKIKTDGSNPDATFNLINTKK